MPTSDHIVKKGVLQRYSGREVVQHTAAVYILIATFLSHLFFRVTLYRHAISYGPVSVCQSHSHRLAFYQNGRTDRADFDTEANVHSLGQRPRIKCPYFVDTCRIGRGK